MRALALPAVLAALLIWPATASSDTASTARAFARVVVQEADRYGAAGRAGLLGAERATKAARGCLGDWRAAPLARRHDLYDVYQRATGAPLAERQIPVATRWVRRLRDVPAADRLEPLLRARQALAVDLRLLQDVYGEPLDACALVREWRAAGWTPAGRPPALVRLSSLLAADQRGALGRQRTLFRGARLLQRRGGRLGRRAAFLLRGGIPYPDAMDRCDPVFEVLAPDDSFCA